MSRAGQKWRRIAALDAGHSTNKPAIGTIIAATHCMASDEVVASFIASARPPPVLTRRPRWKEDSMSLLMRWTPFEQMRSEMNRFRRDMGRLFEDWNLEPGGNPALAVSYPAINMWEDEGFVYAEAELPGLKLEELEIYVTGEDQLTIKGKRVVPAAPPKATWHRQERGFGAFERVLTLPIPVDAAKVEARLEQGVLTIKMAKSEAAKPKKIVVQAE
jgi:HSP20 family protein